MSGTNPPGRPIVQAPTTRRSWFTHRRIVLVCTAGVGIGGIIMWIMLTPTKVKEEPVKPPSHSLSAAYDPPKPTPVPAVAPQPRPPPGQLPMVPPPPLPPPVPQFQTQTPKPEKPTRPAVYTFGGGAAQQTPEYMKPKPDVAATQPPGASTGIAYKSATIAGAKTMTIPDRNLLLMPGPLICIMDTAIDTDVAGPFQCHLDRDAVSPTNVVLMEKGTNIIGGYGSGTREGQSRVVAVTGFATTPNGVVVPLGGPIADQLGAGGVEGSVDNHWMQRLGGALLLSLVDGAFQLAQSELQKAGSTNLNISSGSGVSSLASQLLAKTINIPPTITINQGTTVALWNTGIIDFSPSYKLEMAR